MADIDVVPKKSGTGWLMWVVLAIIALIVVWLLMRGNPGGEVSNLIEGASHLDQVTVTSAARS